MLTLGAVLHRCAKNDDLYLLRSLSENIFLHKVTKAQNGKKKGDYWVTYMSIVLQNNCSNDQQIIKSIVILARLELPAERPDYYTMLLQLS